MACMVLSPSLERGVAATQVKPACSGPSHARTQAETTQEVKRTRCQDFCHPFRKMASRKNGLCGGVVVGDGRMVMRRPRRRGEGDATSATASPSADFPSKLFRPQEVCIAGLRTRSRSTWHSPRAIIPWMHLLRAASSSEESGTKGDKTPESLLRDRCTCKEEHTHSDTLTYLHLRRRSSRDEDTKSARCCSKRPPPLL